VREVWALRTDYTPSVKQIHAGLKDKSMDIRVLWILRKEFIPTAEQIEKGLKSKSNRFRKAWSTKVSMMHAEMDEVSPTEYGAVFAL